MTAWAPGVKKKGRAVSLALTTSSVALVALVGANTRGITTLTRSPPPRPESHLEDEGPVLRGEETGPNRARDRGDKGSTGFLILRRKIIQCLVVLLDRVKMTRATPAALAAPGLWTVLWRVNADAGILGGCN
jgi:hypothetical protein